MAAQEVVVLSLQEKQSVVKGACGELRVDPAVLAEMERRKTAAIRIFGPANFPFKTNTKTSKLGESGVDFEFHRVENGPPPSSI